MNCIDLVKGLVFVVTVGFITRLCQVDIGGELNERVNRLLDAAVAACAQQPAQIHIGDFSEALRRDRDGFSNAGSELRIAFLEIRPQSFQVSRRHR